MAHARAPTGINPFAVLETARKELIEIICNKFDDAVDADDDEAVQRHFKLFPLVGIADQGLEKYGRYAGSKISVQANKHLQKTFNASGTQFCGVLVFFRC